MSLRSPTVNFLLKGEGGHSLIYLMPKFHPTEILFSPTTQCNLQCAHCGIKRNRKFLPKKTAVKFLAECRKIGIRRVGFTGGEPFLALDFLCAIIKEAVRRDFSFSRIITNGSCFRSKKNLGVSLNRLFNAGYDGDICVSVDAFHRQDLRKVVSFIKTAVEIWGRRDIISIVAVKGARDGDTNRRLLRLSRLLNGHLTSRGRHTYIRGTDGLFMKVLPVDLSPIGKAARLKNPWDGKWFKDDFCKGPGNVFYVLPDGTVKPCCGYANESDLLTIGSIKYDTSQKIIKNAEKNRFVSAAFGKGLHSIRRTLEASGVRFPGKTSNHCFFCHYLTPFFGR